MTSSPHQDRLLAAADVAVAEVPGKPLTSLHLRIIEKSVREFLEKRDPARRTT